MPRYPNFSHRIQHARGSVFEKYRQLMKDQGENLVRLHIGDTYLPPRYPLPIDPVFMDKHTGFNRYCSTFGIEPLREALVDKLQAENHLPVAKPNVLIVNGATNGLSVCTQGVLEPGEDVLILAPYWPFFKGMVGVAGANPVEVPFYTHLFDNPNLDIRAYLQPYLSERTVALYLNTPNNPSGKVLTSAQVQQVADFAREHDLWIISDEAYDGLTFDGHPHISIASLPGMFERTLSIFTFSKTYMFAGLRLGYLVGDAETVVQLNKVMVHQLYSPATISQQMMVDPVRTRQRWMPDLQVHYQELRDRFLERVDYPIQVPEGTYFFFFSVKDFMGDQDITAFVEKCIRHGVSVAPGEDFGADYEHFIRICFTGESPQRLHLAAERLNALLNTSMKG